MQQATEGEYRAWAGPRWGGRVSTRSNARPTALLANANAACINANDARTNLLSADEYTLSLHAYHAHVTREWNAVDDSDGSDDLPTASQLSRNANHASSGFAGHASEHVQVHLTQFRLQSSACYVADVQFEL